MAARKWRAAHVRFDGEWVRPRVRQHRRGAHLEPGLDEAPAPGGGSVIGFALPSSTEVDRLHAELTSAGYRSRLAPHDAFWGGRYGIVLDPDHNQVGLMGPIDPQRGFTPAV